MHTAAAAGCSGVEIDALREVKPSDLSETGLRQLRKMLDDLNLRVASVAFPNRHGFSSPVVQQQRVDAALDTIRMAARLGARQLLINVHDAEDDSARPVLVAALEGLASRGVREGVVLVGRTGGADTESLKALAGELPELALGFDIDPGELVALGIDPGEQMSSLAGSVAAVHTTDAVRELGSSSGVMVQLGRGAVDYPALLGTCEEIGYNGWLTAVASGADAPADEIGDAVKYLESVVRG